VTGRRVAAVVTQACSCGRRVSVLLLLSCAILATAIVTGCVEYQRPTVEELAASLPTEAAGDTFDETLVVDEAYLSGFSVDDPLALLGKARSDAAAVFIGSSQIQGGVGALAVTGVDGSALLDAIVRSWNAASVTSRQQTVIDGRQVWILTERDGRLTAFYLRGHVVYIAGGTTMDRIHGYLQAMP
jgi:hypothetical protein